MQTYHNHIVTSAKSGISRNQLVPPPEVCLNNKNINIMEKAILDVYKNKTPGSLYEQIKTSPFWGIMHDDISKFSTEYNGVFLRGIDEGNDPFKVPYLLNKMKGGVNSYDLGKFISYKN